MIYRIFTYILLSFFSVQSFAQDTTVLAEIELSTETLIHKDIGKVTITPDSNALLQHQGGNMAQVLQNETPVFIKSYGPNALQSVGFRGASASHTHVAWQGIPLNNINNGITDFSLISNAFTSIEIVTGASATRYGSSAIGGTILIRDFETKLDYNETTTINMAMGSFGYGHLNTKQLTPFNRGVWQSSFSLQQSNNNFSFTNFKRVHHPVQTLKNAGFYNWNKKDQVNITLNNKHQIQYNHWFYHSNRQLPGGMANMPNIAFQKDGGQRMALLWRFISEKRKLQLRTKTYWISDQLWYNDAESGINSRANTVSFGISEQLEHTFYSNNNIQLQYSLHNNFQEIQSRTQAFGQKSEWILHQYASLQAAIPKIKIRTQFRLRKEWRQHTTVPLIPSFGLEGKWHFIALFANFGKHYRVPTFNDLFWQPGGNPNLLPESGSSIDATIKFNFLKHFLTFQITYYQLEVKDWIQWIPTSTSFWSPQNLHLVSSKGIETLSQLNFTKGNWKYRFTYQWMWNQSINSETSNQLIYTPKMQHKIASMISFKQWMMRWTYNYQGIRFTTSDNMDFLPAQSIQHIMVAYTFKNHPLSLTWHCNNLLNDVQQGVEGQVQMPRHYLFSIQLKL